ncbi:hypothetical protein TNCV_2671231 [Trichonephila clavipes]|nr:hypothetical protein TNCV_2671231 [Trichonephila clavipes]
MREIKRVKQRWDMDQRVLFKSKLNEMKAINEKIQMEQENEWKIKEVEWKAEIGALKIKLENVLGENKICETKEQEWKIEKYELKTENRTLKKKKLQSRVAVDKVLKRMIRSNRKLRRITPFRFKRPRPAIVHASFISSLLPRVVSFSWFASRYYFAVSFSWFASRYYFAVRFSASTYYFVVNTLVQHIAEMIPILRRLNDPFYMVMVHYNTFPEFLPSTFSIVMWALELNCRVAIGTMVLWRLSL